MTIFLPEKLLTNLMLPSILDNMKPHYQRALMTWIWAIWDSFHIGQGYE